MVLMEKAEKLKCEEYEMYQINLYCIDCVEHRGRYIIVIRKNNLSLVKLHKPCASYMGYYIIFYREGHDAGLQKHWFTTCRKRRTSTQCTGEVDHYITVQQVPLAGLHFHNGCSLLIHSKL